MFQNTFQDSCHFGIPHSFPLPWVLHKKTPTKPQEIHNTIPILMVLCYLWKSLYYPHIFIWPNGEQENPFSLKSWCTRPGSSWAQGAESPSPKSTCLTELCDPAQNPALAPPPLRLLSPDLLSCLGLTSAAKGEAFPYKGKNAEWSYGTDSTEGHSSPSQSLVASPPTS